MLYRQRHRYSSESLYLSAFILLAILVLPNSILAATAESSLSQKGLSERMALDHDLTRRIQIDLVTNENINSNPKYIHVVTVDGGLTLQGHVTSLDEKKKIEQIAKKVIGAKEIVNQLEVGD